MAYIFGDGFDCYAAPADMDDGYWDVGGNLGFTLGAGRFSGSQGLVVANVGTWLIKSSGINDSVHHVAVAVQQTSAISGSTVGPYIQFVDGSTIQCSVAFRSDGAIILTAGAANGTVLDTYTGAITAQSTWYQFEIEVVVSNTAGSMSVRKLGNTTNDFTSAGARDTSQTANNYANKLQVGCQNSLSGWTLDDLLWRSDASSVPWVGDIRCFTRRPASDAAVQWSRSGSGTAPIAPPTLGANTSLAGGVATFLPFTPPVSGTVGLVTYSSNANSSNPQKCAIYASSGGVPTSVLGTATENLSIAIGTMNCVFPTPVPVTAGVSYFVAIVLNSAVSVMHTASATAGVRSTVAYASFPTANPSGLSTNTVVAATVVLTLGAPANWPYVSEPQQDAATSYVYSSNVGDSDLYGISAISSTPASIVAVTTRAYLQKSDAGTRNTSVQLKSGSTTVSSASAALNTSWAWQSRTDQTDPATGAAWTAVGVNNAQVGMIVTA